MSMLYRTCTKYANYYLKTLEMYMQQLDDIRARVDVMAADRDQKADTICQLEGLISELQQDNKRYAALNRDLNVRAQGIRTVTVTEKVSSGRRGRPKGQKPSITRRPVNIDRAETVDCSVCPDCGDDNLSGVTDQYSRVVEHMKVTWENVQYKIKRRYCRNCQKQVSAKVPGVNAQCTHIGRLRCRFDTPQRKRNVPRQDCQYKLAMS